VGRIAHRPPRTHALSNSTHPPPAQTAVRNLAESEAAWLSSNIRATNIPLHAPVPLTHRGTAHELCRTLSLPPVTTRVTPRNAFTLGHMRIAAVVGCAAIAVLTGSCSLLAPVAPAVVPTFSATTTTPAPVVPIKAGLPTRCKDLLNGQQLDAVLGLPLSGVVRTVLGQPSPSVGLSYGIPSPSGGYALQLSAETYRDDAAAAARTPVNVDALRTPVVNPIPITIGPTTAMYLPLPDGPFLIASTGIYAVSVTLGPTSFTPDKAPAAAAEVAAMVLTMVRGGTAASAVSP